MQSFSAKAIWLPANVVQYARNKCCNVLVLLGASTGCTAHGDDGQRTCLHT